MTVAREAPLPSGPLVVFDFDHTLYDADSGTLVVTPNLAVEAASDQRTHAEKMLAVIEAEIQARIDGTGSAHDAYGIAGRSIQKLKMTELEAMRAKYGAEVARQRNGGVANARDDEACIPPDLPGAGRRMSALRWGAARRSGHSPKRAWVRSIIRLAAVTSACLTDVVASTSTITA